MSNNKDNIEGEVSSMSQPLAFYEKMIPETKTHMVAIPTRASKVSTMDLHKQERLACLVLREHVKQ